MLENWEGGWCLVVFLFCFTGKNLTENSVNSAWTSLIVFHARILGEIFCGYFSNLTFSCTEKLPKTLKRG